MHHKQLDPNANKETIKEAYKMAEKFFNILATKDVKYKIMSKPTLIDVQ